MSENEVVRVRALVTGRVQGVFYRASTLEQAQGLGVKGSVQNLPDDTVEIIAQGESDSVEALLEWAHRGPPSADVRTVHIRKLPLDQGLVTFRVID